MESPPLTMRDMFKVCFNHRLYGQITYLHQQFIEQLAVEDLDFLCTHGLSQLFSLLKSQKRYDLVVMAFRTAEWLLDPTQGFQEIYFKLNKGKEAQYHQSIKGLKQYISIVIQETLRNGYLNSDFMADLANFYKADAEK